MNFSLLPDPTTASALNICSAIVEIQRILSYSLKISGIIAILVIAWGALQYGLAFGDQSRAQRGKQIITAAVAGLAIMFFAVSFVATVWFVFLGRSNPSANLSFLKFITGDTNAAIPGCDGSSDGTPATSTGTTDTDVVDKEVESATTAATKLFQDKLKKKYDTKTGPCLGTVLSGKWAVDVEVGVAKTDNANRCDNYSKTKTVNNLIILDPSGHVLRVFKNRQPA